MSSPADPKVRAYLKRQLARNPWEESERIVAERARALRLRPRAAASAGVDTGEERQRLRNELDALRTTAFTAPLPELSERLARLKLDDYPDLRSAAERLRTILASRSVLPQLTGHRDFNPDFLACFKEVLVSPARDTAVLRERVLNSFGNRKLRKSGVRMIRLLEKQAPALCALERPWLDALTKQKHRSGGAAAAGSASEKANPGWVVAAVVIFIVLPALRALSRFGDEEQPARKPPTVSSPAVPTNQVYPRTDPSTHEDYRERAYPRTDPSLYGPTGPLPTRDTHRELLESMKSAGSPWDADPETQLGTAPPSKPDTSSGRASSEQRNGSWTDLRSNSLPDGNLRPHDGERRGQFARPRYATPSPTLRDPLPSDEHGSSPWDED